MSDGGDRDAGRSDPEDLARPFLEGRAVNAARPEAFKVLVDIGGRLANLICRAAALKQSAAIAVVRAGDDGDPDLQRSHYATMLAAIDVCEMLHDADRRLSVALTAEVAGINADPGDVNGTESILDRVEADLDRLDGAQ